MAVVHHLELVPLQVQATHSDAEATYALIRGSDGALFLQIDTYGSRERQMVGKKSQSIRFSPEAIEELKAIISKHF